MRRSPLILLVLLLVCRGGEAQVPRDADPRIELRTLAGGVFSARMIQRTRRFLRRSIPVGEGSLRWFRARGLEPLALGERTRLRLGERTLLGSRALPGSPNGSFSGPLEHDPQAPHAGVIVRWSAPPGADVRTRLETLRQGGVLAVIAPSAALTGKAWEEGITAKPLPIPLLSCTLGAERILREASAVAISVEKAAAPLLCGRIPGAGCAPSLGCFAWGGPSSTGTTKELAAAHREALLVVQEAARSLSLTIACGQVRRPPGAQVFGVVFGPLEAVRKRVDALAALEGLSATLLVGPPEEGDVFLPRLSGAETSPVRERAERGLRTFNGARGFWKKAGESGRMERSTSALELGVLAEARGTARAPSSPVLLTGQARAVLAILWELAWSPKAKGTTKR